LVQFRLSGQLLVCRVTGEVNPLVRFPRLPGLGRLINLRFSGLFLGSPTIRQRIEICWTVGDQERTLLVLRDACLSLKIDILIQAEEIVGSYFFLTAAKRGKLGQMLS